jgi:hypothetical protein
VWLVHEPDARGVSDDVELDHPGDVHVSQHVQVADRQPRIGEACQPG